MSSGFWTLNAEQLADEMTKAVKITLGHLYEQGLISQDTYDNYDVNYFITVKKPARISPWWKKIFQTDKDGAAEGYRIFLTKQCTLPTMVEEKERNFKVIEGNFKSEPVDDGGEKDKSE